LSATRHSTPHLLYFAAVTERIAIIGGGAAGFMAAVTAAERGASACLYERGRALASVLRTGGGRCNITNSVPDRGALAAQYPRGEHFLLSVFSRFSNLDAVKWFESRGLPLAEEEGGRIFPASRDARDVRDLFLALASRTGVELREETPVLGVAGGTEGFLVASAGGREAFRAVVVATGGRTAPGAADAVSGTASGYDIARGFGHAVGELRPALAALRTQDSWFRGLSGLTVPSACIRASFRGRRVAEEEGSLLFTHTGVSGPLAFRISSRCAFLPYGPEEPLALALDLVPDIPEHGMEAQLTRLLAENPRRRLSTVLRAWAPQSLLAALLGGAGLDGEKPCAQVGRVERRKTVEALKRAPLAACGTERGGEMVTAGGVSLDEVRPATMESRRVKGLYFCGEVLDIDGFTGGFNLQAAWSTGFLAGAAASGSEGVTGV